MRKGRLIAKYEFKELEIEQAQTLSQKLGYTTTFNSPATLTAIYNQEEKDFQQEKRRTPIGFKSLRGIIGFIFIHQFKKLLLSHANVCKPFGVVVGKVDGLHF